MSSGARKKRATPAARARQRGQGADLADVLAALEQTGLSSFALSQLVREAQASASLDRDQTHAIDVGAEGSNDSMTTAIKDEGTETVTTGPREEEVVADPTTTDITVPPVVDEDEAEGVDDPSIYPLPPVGEHRMTVTPEMARVWLKRHNSHNRKEKKEAILEYTTAMREGAWRYNAVPIIFGEGDFLVDGQNRLISVAASDRAQRFLVVRDPEITEDDQMTIDQGVSRSTADNLKLLGYNNTSSLGGGAVLALRMAKGDFPSMRLRLRTPEIVDFLRDHPEFTDHASYAAAHWKKFDVAPAVLAYSRWVLYGVDREAAEAFFENWRTSNTGGEGNALATLVEKLKVLRNSQKRVDQHAQLLMVMKTWNAHVQGKGVQRFQIKHDKRRLPIPRPLAPRQREDDADLTD